MQETVDNALQEAKDSGEFDGRDGTDGQDGVTYTPSVDAAGNISWTNDGGLPNPQPRNIKGPQGEPLTYADLTAADKEDLIQGPIADAQTAAVNAVNSAGTSNVSAVNSAGTTQVSNVNQAGETQTAAVQQKGEEAIAELQEYADLPEDVADLKSAINDPVTGLDTKAPIIVNSASGNIASFADGADGLPIKALTVNVEPIQDLHGYDSPWPAGGGKNLLSYPYVDTTFTRNTLVITDNGDGTITANGTPTDTVYFNFRTPNDTIALKAGSYKIPATGNSYIAFNWYYKNGTALSTGESERTFTLTEDAEVYCFLRFAGSAQLTNVVVKPMLLLSTETDLTFAPYSNICPITGWNSVNIYHSGADTSNPTVYTIQLGDTVYGGTLDVTGGKMVVTHKFETYNGTENWDIVSSRAYLVLWNQTPSVGNNDLSQIANWLVGGGAEYNKFGKYRVQSNGAICVGNIIDLNNSVYKWASASEFKAYLADNPLQSCYELATPFEITLTPTEITTLLGTNNIWSDAGNASVDYSADTKLYIDKKLAALVAALS